jgi:hypothetical protein
VTERHRPVHQDVVAARRRLDRVQARIRAEGEAPLIAGIWDAVVDEIAALPEVQDVSAAAKRPARVSQRLDGPPSAAEDEAEAVHQAVVKLVQHAQRTGRR